MIIFTVTLCDLSPEYSHTELLKRLHVCLHVVCMASFFDPIILSKALWHLDSFRELLLASHHTHAGQQPTRQRLVPPPAGTGVRVCAGMHSVDGDGGCGNIACRGGTLCVSNCTSKESCVTQHHVLIGCLVCVNGFPVRRRNSCVTQHHVLYSLYTPFIHL